MKLHDPPGSEEKQRKLRKPNNQGKRRLSFEIEAPAGAQVFVAGSFNDWDPSAHRLTDKDHSGTFRRHVYVEPGMIEYKFVVDGEWQIDSNCARWTPNRFGSLNSVVEV